MTSGIKSEWTEAISTWAENRSEVQEVYFYGSRVRGGYRPDSDLDVAVIIEGDDGLSLATWFFDGRDWADELNSLVDVEVHLEMATESDGTVMPAVRQHGVRIYAKG